MWFACVFLNNKEEGFWIKVFIFSRVDNLRVFKFSCYIKYAYFSVVRFDEKSLEGFCKIAHIFKGIVSLLHIDLNFGLFKKFQLNYILLIIFTMIFSS